MIYILLRGVTRIYSEEAIIYFLEFKTELNIRSRKYNNNYILCLQLIPLYPVIDFTKYKIDESHQTAFFLPYNLGLHEESATRIEFELNNHSLS